MNYKETLDYLYTTLPMFQNIGAAAINKGLDKTLQLLEILDNPQRKFKSIHIAGTNGKGSTSSMLSAILQSSGYKTGLYTSPHLKRFTERIKIDGKEIPDDTIVEFVNRMVPEIERIRPSFFELTVAMAFEFFAREKVDVAVVEVGMGGRLDSTNVILPELCIITNISLDHQSFLGNTLEEIAREKAGIIKKGVPIIVSEVIPETRKVFEEIASAEKADLYFASEHYKTEKQGYDTGKMIIDVSVENNEPLIVKSQLTGHYQLKNIPGVLAAAEILKGKFDRITPEYILKGIANVTDLTGLKGRWQTLSLSPLIICDTGHNEAGIREIVRQLESVNYNKLHIVIGVVKDKDVSKILNLLPRNASYYFTQPTLPRALDAGELAEKAAQAGLQGITIRNVNEAVNRAKQEASPEDLIFIGGSTFVVAEVEGL